MTQPTYSEIQANLAEWRDVAQLVCSGCYDTPPQGKRIPRRPPSGTLAKSLIIGLRGQAGDRVVDRAMRHIASMEQDDPLALQ